jgi:chromosome partitioning protein
MNEIFDGVLQPMDLEDIRRQSEVAADMVEKVRRTVLAPTAKKLPPLLYQKDLYELCDLERGAFVYRLKASPELPQGTTLPNRRIEFSLAEARKVVRELRASKLRPAYCEAVVISVANFKGGVGKSTTAMTMAQGLSLLGHKILLIDADPQASLTTLTGLLPEHEVGEGDTIFPLMVGDETSIRPAIRSTYWDGIDLVAASADLFNVEFVLPSRQVKELKNGFQFWNVLNLGIDDVREDYDFVIIDTSPSLSYGTVNALFASNGIVVPLPPNALDYSSGAQFWSLLSDLSDRLGIVKKFDFVNVLLSRVDPDQASAVVKRWIFSTYGDKVMPVEIPRTIVTSNASTAFGTVFDRPVTEHSAKTRSRARDAYFDLAKHVERLGQAIWARQLVQVVASSVPLETSIVLEVN